MKVKIGKYSTWFGPYQLAEALCFWVRPTKDEYGFASKPDWVHTFGEFLAYGKIQPEQKVGETLNLMARSRKTTKLYKLLSWVESKKSRTIKVRIDPYDTWCVYSTLALITLPMLKQLKAVKHGAGMVDAEDSAIEDTFERWDWVLDEMIFAFEHIVDTEWESKFFEGKGEMNLLKLENGMLEYVPDTNLKTDFDGLKLVNDRIDNGLRLFGKYYRSLWD